MNINEVEDERRNSSPPGMIGHKRKRCSSPTTGANNAGTESVGIASSTEIIPKEKRQCMNQKGQGRGQGQGKYPQRVQSQRSEEKKQNEDYDPQITMQTNMQLLAFPSQQDNDENNMVAPPSSSSSPGTCISSWRPPAAASSAPADLSPAVPVPVASVLRTIGGTADKQMYNNSSQHHQTQSHTSSRASSHTSSHQDKPLPLPLDKSSSPLSSSPPPQHPQSHQNAPDSNHLNKNNPKMITMKETTSKMQDTLQNNTDMDRIIEEVDRRYYQVAFIGFVTWLILSLLSFHVAIISENGRLEKLSGVEEKAPLIASMLLGMSLFSSTMPLFVKQVGGKYGHRQSGGTTTTSRSLHSTELSGIMACSITVHFVAFITDLLMAKFPTPVFPDPVSGTKVYLLRWCEWTPLAFVMTFVTEACRNKEDDNDEVVVEDNCGVGVSPLKRILSQWRNSDKLHEEEHASRRYTSETDHEDSDRGDGSAAQSDEDDDERDNDDSNNNSDGDNYDDGQRTVLDNIMTELRPAYILATTQGASTMCGWLFPFCTNIIIWSFMMFLSFLFFAMIFVRCHRRSVAFKAMKPGATIAQQEFYHWAELSLRLLKTCRNMWSVLVVAYFVYTMGPLFFPQNKILNMSGLTMTCESVIDVLFKSVYMMVIVDVHHAIFDQNTRVERRLEEMRKMMGVVWDNSSDVICISVRNINGNVTTMLSPTFLKICSSLEVDEGIDGHGQRQRYNNISCVKSAGNSAASQNAKAIAFELDSKAFEKGQRWQRSPHPNRSSTDDIEPRIMYNVHFNDLINDNRNVGRVPCSRSGNSGSKRRWGKRKSSMSHVGENNPISEEITSMARLVVRAWKTDKNVNMIMHELVRTKGDEGGSKNTERTNGIRFEANLTRMEDNAMLIVVRDISERVRRFEAEKKVISETTARRKDAAANRFTRHEVKNGLLAAIGLCDSLREAEDKDRHLSGGGLTKSHGSLQSMRGGLKRHELRRNGNANSSLVSSSSNIGSGSNTKRYLFELDKTLHEILDTVLAEAMARDVIHEVYEPKLERVDVAKLLYSTISVPGSNDSFSNVDSLNGGGRNNKRFPIITVPSVLPEYALDPQLLKCIHRNAISNACKYGKRGGEIRTQVFWDRNTGTLRMDVMNLPGPRHADILRLGSLASEIVFSPRKRLTVHSALDCNDQSPTHSSGDGAWIMNKCAKTLGGSCEIKFEPNNTVFTFTCPVMPYHEMLATANISHEGFEMPKNVWGIALDDSKIQRKLLVRFFMYVGIPEDHICIFGANGDEIKGFDTWAVSFINAHPNDYFLMIIDENLDVQEEDATVSGSLAISDMRSRLVPDQERRVLALIRSANDSASDVAIYQARAHGFLPKAPIKKESVREVLVPMWLKRFPRFENSIKMEKIGKMAIEDIEGEVVIAMEDLIPCIDEINNFASMHNDDLIDKWNIIWEKLHALKGDLLIMPNHAALIEAIRLISTLRGPAPPDKFHEKWQSIRSFLQSYQIASLEGDLGEAQR